MDPTDLPQLPPQLEHALAYITIGIAALTGLAQGLRWAVPRLRAVAERTVTTTDDRVVEWLARALGWLTTALDWTQRLAPQLRLGTPTPAASSRPPSGRIPPGGVVATLLICALSLLLTGCATWADSARTTIEVSAVAVDVADHAIAAALSSTCASVAELPAGDARAAALDACLDAHHYDDAIAAIRVADRALRAAQAAVDAGERFDDDAPWREVAACLAASVQEVLAAVTAAGVDVPPELVTGAHLLAGIAGTCGPAEATATVVVATSGGAS